MNGEHGYLALVRQIINTGRLSSNRTGIDTKSIFGGQLRFDLTNQCLPILTTKKISFHTVAIELLWFIRGSTNQRWLEKRKVNIWRANSTREFLDSRKLHHYKEFETLGPIYGFQWRHFGAKYVDCHTDYTGCGVDQLKTVVDQIKNDPESRRIILSAWNPPFLDQMALPPCHVLVQFEVNVEKRQLSAHLYQRSADMMLGVPYNILSYSLLVHILARKCNLTAGELVCSYGNAHVYENHLDTALIQLERTPLDMAKLEMSFPPNIAWEDLDVDNHFRVINYNHHGTLKYDMAV